MRSYRIEGVAKGGLGIARTDRGVVLVEGALPGETVRAAPVGRRGGAPILGVTEILEAAPGRRTAPCPHYSRCGGCDLQHADYPSQLALKREILLDCLRRIAGVPSFEVSVVASPELGYRRRTKLRVDDGPAGLRPGYYRRRSRTIEPVRTCPILVPALERLLGELPAALVPGVREVSALAGDDALSLVLGTTREAAARSGTLRERLERLGVSELALAIDGEGPQAVADGVEVRVRERTLRASARAFFQGNASLLDALVAAVLDPLPARLGRAWDLYAGVGLFTVELAARAREVIAVESDPHALALLARNLPRRHHRGIVAGTELDLLRRRPERPEACVVDPPRPGLPRQARELLVGAGIPRVVLVGCDAASFARDLGAFVASGYEVLSLTMLDLYPQSAHLEVVAQLARA